MRRLLAACDKLALATRHLARRQSTRKHAGSDSTIAEPSCTTLQISPAVQHTRPGHAKAVHTTEREQNKANCTVFGNNIHHQTWDVEFHTSWFRAVNYISFVPNQAAQIPCEKLQGSRKSNGPSGHWPHSTSTRTQVYIPHEYLEPLGKEIDLQSCISTFGMCLRAMSVHDPRLTRVFTMCLSTPNGIFCRLPINSIQGSVIGTYKKMVLVANGNPQL